MHAAALDRGRGHAGAGPFDTGAVRRRRRTPTAKSRMDQRRFAVQSHRRIAHARPPVSLHGCGRVRWWRRRSRDRSPVCCRIVVVVVRTLLILLLIVIVTTSSSSSSKKKEINPKKVISPQA